MSTVTNRQGRGNGHPADTGGAASEASRPAESPPASRRVRSFMTLARVGGDEERGVLYEGVGMTLDHAVADVVDGIEKGMAKEVPRFYRDADDFLADMGDEVVWGPEPDRIAAVILPRPGGVKVVRLDREVPELPEVGPTNVKPSYAPPDPPPRPLLTRDEEHILELARDLGPGQASSILFASSSLKEEIVPGSHGSRVTEAMGRLLLLPEDRFIWRRAAGFTTTDDEAREAMERIKAENPGWRVAEVLTFEERQMLEKLRAVGLAEADAILASVLALDLTVDEALGRLAGPGISPIGEAPKAPDEEPIDEEEAGAITSPRPETMAEIDFAPQRRLSAPPAFTVTVQEFMQYHTHRPDETLDSVIAEESIVTEGYAYDEDRAIWHDGRCVALVRLVDGREPEVFRMPFDEEGGVH